MNILKIKKENDSPRINDNRQDNVISFSKYNIDKEAYQGQNLFNSCLELNENDLKKNIKKSWSIMLNGIDTPLDDYGNTALHLATIQNDYELVSLLLLKGANPNVRNNGNIKPIMIAKILEFPDIYKVLLMHENGSYMNLVAEYSPKNDDIGNISKETSTISKKTSVSTITSTGTVRSRSRKQRGSKLLSTLNFDDREGNIMPSQMPNLSSNNDIKGYGTVRRNRSSTIDSTSGTDPLGIYTNFTNDYDRQKNFQYHKKYFPKYYLSVFNMAYLGIYKDKLYSLFDSENIEEADENGSTPLMKAAYGGHTDVVEKLIEKNANIHACDKMGYTALVWAALKGHDKICEILVKKGADVNKVYGKGKALAVITPLIAAAYSGTKNTVITLINLGADINKEVGPGNTTALIVATLKYRFEIVDELLKRDAKFDNDIEWISDGAFFMKILEKSHNHWIVNENFIDNLIMDRGNSTISILMNLKNSLIKEKTKKINSYSKQDKKNIKDMKSIYQHYIIKETNPEIKHVISSSIIKNDSSALLSTDSVCVERNQQIRNKYSYIEEIVGNSHFSPTVHELILLIPLYGTELDVMWFNILRCGFQLIELVNKNEKEQYMYLYSKLEYYLGILTKEISKTYVIYTIENKKQANNYSLFNNTLLITKIKDMSKRISNELYDLFYQTKLSIGCWPPIDAIQNMVNKMINLVKKTFYLTKLANATGFFPKVDGELNFEYKIEENFENENVTDFQTYQQINNLKNYGKNLNNKKNELALSIDNFSTESDDNQLAFSKLIDDHIHHIEHASNELFQSFMHPNENISAVINDIREKIDILIYDINNNSDFNNYSDKEVFTQEDINLIIIQTKNITEEGAEFLKSCVNKPLKSIITKEVDDIKDIEIKINNVFVNNNEEINQIFDDELIRGDLIKILQPCLTKIKYLGFIAKKASEKIQNLENESKQKNFDKVRKHFVYTGIINPKKKMENINNFDLNDPESKELLKEKELDSLIFENSEDESVKIIKGGKISKLIDCLTWTNDQDFITVNGFKIEESFKKDFFMTHHSMISSKELYSAFINRYRNLQRSQPSELDNAKFQLIQKKKNIPTQIHILNIINEWIELLKPEDSCMDDDIIDDYDTFVTKAAKNELKEFTEKIDYIQIRKKTRKGHHNPTHTSKSKKKNEEPVLPKHITMNDLEQLTCLLKNDGNYIYSVPEKEFARQLTLIESEYYKLVTGTECFDQIWGPKRKKEFKNKDEILDYPNVSRMICHTNLLTTWVASCILNSGILKERENALKYFIQLANECYKINNFNGVTAIVAGLSMGPVFRLHNTWGLFREKNRDLNEIYTLISETVSPKGQYSNYRKKLKELDDKNEQIMPFLGVYFTDLTFVELGNNDYLDKNLNINFEKRRKAARIVNEIKHYQEKTFDFVPVKPIQDFIMNLDKYENQPHYTEDELYDLSLKYEPREDDDDDDDDDDE